MFDISGNGPLVVLESGLGGGVREWDEVTEGLTGCTVVRRLRPGLDGSPVGCRDAAVAAAELIALLDQLEGGVVLVGHSLGALHVRLVAIARPDRVLGLVLVDPSTEQALTRDPEMMAGFAAQGRIMDVLLRLGPLGRGVFRRLFVRLMAGQLAGERRPVADRALTELAERLRAHPGAQRAIRAELAGMARSLEQVRDAGPLPQVPLRVITQGRSRTKPEQVAMLARWQGFHAELAATVPDGTQAIAEHSGHLVPLEQPDLIVSAVRQLLGVAAS